MKQAHMQPVVFSARNIKRRKKISQRGFFWIRYGVALGLIFGIYFWVK